MRFFQRWVILLVAAVATVGACSSSSDTADDEPPIGQILADSTLAMTEVESASFTIQQSGAEIYIDNAGQLRFQSAEGQFAAPASAQALVTVEALGFATEVEAVAIDGTLWFTNPLSGDWTVAPANLTFDPATLFDSDVGLPALLGEAAPSAEFIDEANEQSEGAEKTRHRVRTTVTAERMSVLTGGMVTKQGPIDLWIDVATNRVVELQFNLLDDDGVSNWQMTMGDYNADVTIVAPELGVNG